MQKSMNLKDWVVYTKVMKVGTLIVNKFLVTMEKWQQYLKDAMKGCDVEPNSVSLARNFQRNLCKLWKLINLDHAEGSKHILNQFPDR